MTMTKKELVKEILSIEEVDTKSRLMQKSNRELEEILNNLRNNNKVTTVYDNNNSEVENSKEIDEFISVLREQIKKEIESEVRESMSIQNNVKDNQSSKKDEVDRFEMIPIMNVTNGKLVYISKKTGVELVFSEFGDIEYIEFQELLTMRSSQRRFFDEPFIFVMHEGAVEQLGLTKMYENIKNPQRIDDVFKMPQKEFEEILEKSPKGIKHLIISRAKELYEKGELDSIRKINYINERFNAEIGQRG